VKAEWFKYFGEKDRPECFDRIVQSWDTANKAARHFLTRRLPLPEQDAVGTVPLQRLVAPGVG
jgi:hypothetical protein